MKKTIIAISLAAVMLICGCGADAGSITTTSVPQVTSTPQTSTGTPKATPGPAVTKAPAAAETPLPSPKDPAAIIEALTARIKNSVDTGMFEGFTKGSTLQYVFEDTKMKLHDVHVTFAVDFLGYPANMECYFRPALEFYRLYVHPQERTDYEGKITDLINKLEGALGTQAENEFQTTGLYRYSWNMPVYDVDVTARAERFENTGELAEVYVVGYHHVLPADFPDIFPYPPNTEFDTVYENELRLAAVNKDLVYLTYLADDIHIAFKFNDEDTTLIAGHYMLFDIDLPDAGSAADFMEAFMSSVQNVLGKPKDRVYISSEGRYKTGKEVKASGCSWFQFAAHWNGISLSADYDPELYAGVEFDLEFEEDYFNTAASGK